MKKILHGVRANSIPGDACMRLIRSAVDSQGRRWLAGTLYRGLSGGYDNPRRTTYVDVSIEGRVVTFYASAQPKEQQP